MRVTFHAGMKYLGLQKAKHFNFQLQHTSSSNQSKNQYFILTVSRKVDSFRPQNFKTLMMVKGLLQQLLETHQQCYMESLKETLKVKVYLSKVMLAVVQLSAYCYLD